MEAKERKKQEARQSKETKKREKQEAKESKPAKSAKERAKQEAKEAKAREKRKAKEAKERAKLAAQKAKEAKPAKKKAKKAEKVEKAAEPSVDTGTYRGVVTLAIVPPIDLGQLAALKKDLGQVENLRLVLVGGSVEGGSKIIVSAEEPLLLLDILEEMPAVDQVFRKGSEIQVRLKAE